MLERIRSGGQRGADIGGLIAAEFMGMPRGGSIPKGFLTEDGPRPDLGERFGLVEHSSDKYPPRTYLNVKESDGTIRFAVNFDSPGEKCTLKAIEQYSRPYIDVDVSKPIPVMRVVKWIVENNIKTLNVAGNRESTCKGIESFVFSYMKLVIEHEAKYVSAADSSPQETSSDQ